MHDITLSIVTFNNDKNMLKKVLESFSQATLNTYIYVIDNSPTDEFRKLCVSKNVEYIFNNKNLGFGAGHNLAIRKMLGRTKYSLILNPDIYFNKGVLEKLFCFMEDNLNVGFVMPKVLYPDGSLQYLCRLLPRPEDLLLRKFNNRFLSFLANRVSKYELRFADYSKTMDVPYLSGCFMFIRTDIFEEIGFFDERFFIYFEDVDLSRRIHKLYRTVYYPEVAVYHGYERKSNTDIRHFRYIISSGIKYFNKWGWFFDKERELMNSAALSSIL